MRRRRRLRCVHRPQVVRWASQPIYPSNYLLAPVHGRAGSHPSSLFRALSLQTHLRLLSPPPHPPFSLKECAPTLHFPVTSGGQPPRLRDGGVAVLLLSAGELLRAPREPAPERLVRWSYLTLLFPSCITSTWLWCCVSSQSLQISSSFFFRNQIVIVALITSQIIIINV
jgi:hypothetical protein